MKNKFLCIALLGVLLFPPACSKGEKMLHSDFPVVEGSYQMTKEWSVTLPGKVNRRFEEKQMVLWRPGMTIWVSVWGNKDSLSKEYNKEERLKNIKALISPQAFDIDTNNTGKILRLRYRLKEGKEQGAVPACYCFAVGGSGHVQMAIYLDDEKDIKFAQSICGSLKENHAPYPPIEPVQETVRR
jgi:hypothetical protein